MLCTSCGKAIVSAVKGVGKSAPKTIPKVTKIPRYKPKHIPPAPIPDYIPPAGTGTAASGSGKTAAQGTKTVGSGAPISTNPSLTGSLRRGNKKSTIPDVPEYNPSATAVSRNKGVFVEDSLAVKGMKKTGDVAADVAGEFAKDPLSDYLNNMFDSDKPGSSISKNPLDGFWTYFVETGNKKYGMALNRVDRKEGGFIIMIEGQTQTYMEFTGRSTVGISGGKFQLTRTVENIIVDSKIYDKSNYSDLRYNFMLYKMASDVFSRQTRISSAVLYKDYYTSAEQSETISWQKCTRERFNLIRSLWRNSLDWK